MNKNRLEAFSDGVIAIIITIMVLELKVPHGTAFSDLAPVIPTFVSYILSFIYIGIYWNNHHHLLQAVHKMHGSYLWPNLHLLFWLSIIPFTTAWMGENHFAQVPVILYGMNLLMCAIAFTIFTRVLLAHHEKDSPLSRAIGSDSKGNISLCFYIVSIPLSWLSTSMSLAIFVIVAIIWLIPDRRIENTLT